MKIAAGALGAILAVALPSSAAAEQARPARWAQPLRVAGVPNFYRIDDNLYRSAQPTAEGMEGLVELGVRTVVNLRSFHSDRDEMRGLELAEERITMKAWHPEEKEAVRFLRVAVDPERVPVLVHCQHGADRTGAMSAVYRIAVQGWSKEEAVREMVDGGFGFHGIWVNLPEWIRNLDMERIKMEAGID